MPKHGLAHPATGESLSCLEDFDKDDYLKRRFPVLVAEQRGNFDNALDFATRWHPDVVMSDPLSDEARWLGAKLGIRSVCHLWGPVGNCESGDGVVFQPVDTSGYFAMVTAGGGTEIPPFDMVLDPTPPGVATVNDAGLSVKVRYIPYNGADEGAESARGRRPSVCLIWSRFLDALFGADSFILNRIVEFLGRIPVDVRLMMPAEQVSLLDPLPQNVELLVDVPLAGVLDKMDCIVHTGAAGTVMTAAVKGVPQLCIPFTAEAGLNSERIVNEFGAGLVMEDIDFGYDELSDNLMRILDREEYSSAAASLAARIAAQDDPSEIVSRYF